MKLTLLLCVLAVGAFARTFTLDPAMNTQDFRRELLKIEQKDRQLEHIHLLLSGLDDKYNETSSWQYTLSVMLLIVVACFLRCAFCVLRDVRLTLRAYREAERRILRREEKRREALRRREELKRQRRQQILNFAVKLGKIARINAARANAARNNAARDNTATDNAPMHNAPRDNAAN